MSQDVRITQAQADQHLADLRAAIGSSPTDPEHWVSRRERRRRARRKSQGRFWWRRLAVA
jgi:hypothetical protein